jgi:hypothetical protein
MPDGSEDQSVHPIASLAMKLLRKQGHVYSLGREGRERLRRALEKYEGIPEKKAALKEIVCLAWFFEHKKQSPHAARELLDVVDAASGALVAAGEALYVDSEDLHTAARRFQRMMGENGERRAPMVGEEPEDSDDVVKAGYIGKTRRI